MVSNSPLLSPHIVYLMTATSVCPSHLFDELYHWSMHSMMTTYVTRTHICGLVCAVTMTITSMMIVNVMNIRVAIGRGGIDCGCH